MRWSSARSVFVVLLVLGIVAAALAGCGRGSMVGRRADDFSAYYNTFYNAKKAFEKGTEALENIEEPVDQDRYLSVFVGPERVGNQESFKKAIDKSADVLRDHPGSKWVDDALLLIGKAYYYQKNYVGAQQKFEEVISRKDSRVKDEARLWRGRTLLSAERYAAAERVLIEGLEKGRTERWRAMMKLALGDVRVRQGNWREALPLLREGVTGVSDGRVRARALFLRGQVLERLGRPAEAAAAYRSAAAERPRYELTYAAETGALRMMAEAGNVSEALRRLERLARDDKNADNLAELRLLRGQLHQAQDQPDRARRIFKDLLYQDPDAPDRLPLSGDVEGRAHYALATLYRDAYRDFAKAAAHFDTASSSLGRRAGGNAEGETAGRLTRYAVTDVKEQAARYGNVAEAGRRLSRLDSLLRLGAMPQDDFDAFVDSLRRAQAEEQRAAARREQRMRSQQRFRGGRGSLKDRRGGAQRGGGGGAAIAAGAGGSNGASFLFHEDPARVQENRISFQRTWGRRPLVPNWRRIEAISSQREAASKGQPAEVVGPDGRGGAAALPEVDLSAIPRDSAGRRVMRAERTTARYELGNALLLSAQRPDSAAAWFQRVLDEEAGAESDHSVHRRAFYALAEAERAAGRKKKARRRYRQIVQQYPASELARRARVRLREPEGEGTALASRSTSAEAEAGYARAYRQWQSGRYAAALQRMIDVAVAHAGSPSAPRALLAAAQIYMEQADRTGRPLRAPLPVTAPDSLFAPGALFGADTLAARTAPASSSEAPAASPPDSARPGTPRLSDSTATLADSTATLADSAPADSTARGDRTATPRPEPVHVLHLERLLAGLGRRYPETPHAKRAERILRALRERRAPPEATPEDSTSGNTAPADSALVDTAPQDATVREASSGGAPDEAASRKEKTPEEKPPQEKPSEGRPRRTLDPTAGGWTILVASLGDRAEAEALARRFRERYRAGVIEEPPAEEKQTVEEKQTAAGRTKKERTGGERYRVGVGQFSTRREAQIAQRRLQSALPDESRLLRLGPQRN